MLIYGTGYRLLNVWWRLPPGRRSLDGVDSSGDKMTITIHQSQSPITKMTITTVGVGVYSSSDNTIIATIPAFQDDLRGSRLLVLWKYVLRSESTSWNKYMTRLLYISVCLRTRRDTISYSLYIYIYSSETAKLETVNWLNWGL